MKTLITALLTASALLPAAAQAQRGYDTDARAQIRGDDRGDRPDRGDRQHYRQRADVGVSTRAQVQRTGDDRPDRRDRQDFQARQPDDRQDGRPEVTARRQRSGDHRDGPEDYRSNSVEVRQDFRGARQDAAQGRPGWQNYSAFRGNRDVPGQRHGYDDRRGVGGERAWSRDWRGDNRYAWSRYRTANRSAYRLPRYYAPGNWSYGYRRFSIGVTLSSSLWGENYWIGDPYAYRLPDAYGPYRWVRYYDDALLVDIRSGRVVDTVYDIFY